MKHQRWQRNGDLKLEQSYFKFLPFAPAEIVCLALAEILAEKIRACYQRNKARDIYNIGMFAMRPLNQVKFAASSY